MEQQNNISNNTDDTGKMNQNTRIFLFFLLAIILVGLIIVFGVCFWQKYFSKRVGDPIVNVAEKEYAQKQIKQIADPVLKNKNIKPEQKLFERFPNGSNKGDTAIDNNIVWVANGNWFLDGEEISCDYDPFTPSATTSEINTSDWINNVGENDDFYFKTPSHWFKDDLEKSYYSQSRPGIKLQSSTHLYRPSYMASTGGIDIEIEILDNSENKSLNKIFNSEFGNGYPVREFYINSVAALQIYYMRNKKYEDVIDSDLLNSYNNYEKSKLKNITEDILIAYIAQEKFLLKISARIFYVNGNMRHEFLNLADKVINTIKLGGSGIDDTPPTGSISINDGYDMTTYRYVTLDLSASDEDGKMESMTFSTGGEWGAWQPYSKKVYNFELRGWSQESIFDDMVCVMFADDSNNLSKTYCDSIVYKKDDSLVFTEIKSQEKIDDMQQALVAKLLDYNLSLNELSDNDQKALMNAYIYGCYPAEVIAKSIIHGGHTVHPTIHWLTWKTTDEYAEYMDK